MICNEIAMSNITKHHFNLSSAMHLFTTAGPCISGRNKLHKHMNSSFISTMTIGKFAFEFSSSALNIYQENEKQSLGGETSEEEKFSICWCFTELGYIHDALRNFVVLMNIPYSSTTSLNNLAKSN